MPDTIRRREFLRKSSALVLAGSLASTELARGDDSAAHTGLLAGAAEVDISPLKLPVLASGGFLERTGNELHDHLFARGLVLDDGQKRLAIVVVDTLMMPREMLDEIKQKAVASTRIPAGNILISATHTHTAPSVMGALGTGVDEEYAAFLPGKLVECIERAAEKLEPARVGWASVVDSEDTNCRVWILRPDRIGEDPFGKRTIRAMMHPGYQNPDYLGPCGPEDPELRVLSVARSDGSVLAVVANYSMHYFGAAPVSADYFGRFAAMVSEELSQRGGAKPCITMMSHGTSGDQHWMDYSQPRKSIDLETYARRVADRALEAIGKVEYRDGVSLDAAQETLTLRRRLPDEERKAWAETLIEAMGERTKPADRPEVYALEQMHLLAKPERQVPVQVLRIGDLAITAIPCEVYAITGLKLKAQSPFAHTMNVELAGGGEGYIPPPELFPFGGYNTWPARTAGLETTTEPKIVEALLGMLEQLSGKPRSALAKTTGPYVEAILAAKPIAYWPMDDMAGFEAANLAGHPGKYEAGIARFLAGPQTPGLSRSDGPARAAHFAGGRVAANGPLGDNYSVEMWICNLLPNDARAVTGYFFSRGPDGVKGAPGEHLGIGGTYRDGSLAGKLIFFNGDERNQLLVGKTDIAPGTWHHIVLVRQGLRAAVYLNGQTAPEIEGELAPGCPIEETSVFLGGRSDNLFNFEGKGCQATIYDRGLTAAEVSAHYKAATGHS